MLRIQTPAYGSKVSVIIAAQQSSSTHSNSEQRDSYPACGVCASGVCVCGVCLCVCGVFVCVHACGMCASTRAHTYKGLTLDPRSL